MPVRPHGPDEPDRPGGEDEARERSATDDAGASEDPSAALDDDHDNDHDDVVGDGRDDDLDPDEVEERWARIVTELGGGGDPRAWAPDPAAEEDEDHFTPPEPGPVLGGDPLLTMAWIVVVGVPALLVVAAIVWRDAPTWVLQAAGAAFLAGVGLLLWRMPRDREDDPGPGAVV
ncbi:MAG: hypothetical protein GX609_00650 [Actinomycetales bacterium]|nr:hypothetical protein [Actinomycetales bacterium]